MLTHTFEEREDENREIKMNIKTNNNSNKTELVIEGRGFHFSKVAVLKIKFSDPWDPLDTFTVTVKLFS